MRAEDREFIHTRQRACSPANGPARSQGRPSPTNKDDAVMVVLGHGESRTKTLRLIPNSPLKTNSLEGLQRAAGLIMKS